MGRAPAVLPDGLFFRWFGGRGDGSAIAENWSRATDRGAHRLQLPGRLESSGALEGPATALPSSRGPNRTRGKGPGFFGGANAMALSSSNTQSFHKHRCRASENRERHLPPPTPCWRELSCKTISGEGLCV